MALSVYSNWAALEHPNPDMGALDEHPSELAEALAGFCDPFDPSHLLIDSLFDPPIEADSNPYSSLSDPSVLTLSSDPHQPIDEPDFIRCPKRPRSCSDLYHPSNLVFEPNSYCNIGAVIGPSMSSCQVQEFAYFSGCNGEKAARSGGCLSAQSAAARERRKRISEKTQELGRLIPGGNKMNTAEMFHAAFKYVKFLQAQIGMLELMDSIQIQGCKGSRSHLVGEQAQVLLTSCKIQEKLYGTEKCMVPKEVVEALAEDQEIKSNLLISRDIDRFIKSMWCSSDGGVKCLF